jgi:transposase-like protein
VEVSGVPEFPDLTPEPFWTRWPRGWIAGAATVLAIVAAVVLLVRALYGFPSFDSGLTTNAQNAIEGRPNPRVEVITSVQRRRRWSTAEKVRLVEEAMQPGSSVSFVARRYAISPSLLFTWKRRMLEGGREAVAADEDGNVSLEPAGQLELSGAQREHLDRQVVAERRAAHQLRGQRERRRAE